MKNTLQTILKNKVDVLFFICIILNTSIVFSLHNFLTQDSGAHAFNSNILYNLIFGDKTAYSMYFSLNTELVPNMTSHFVMMIFNTFLPFDVAEKLTLLIYFVSFPLLFRKLISLFNENKTFLIFLIFPFTHFCVLYYGFYNFAYGILFFILGIIYWVSNRTDFKIKQILIFFVIVTMSYFSHLVAFIALFMFCVIYEFFEMLIQFRINSFSVIFRDKIKLFFKVLLSFSPSLILVFLYYKNRPSREGSFLPIDKLNDMILNGEVFTSYSVYEEDYSKPLFWFLILLVLYTLITKIENYRLNRKQGKWIQLSDVFFLFSLIFFYLFYTQPNSDGYGGYINIRLAFFAQLILIIWIAVSVKKDIKIEFVSLIIILFLNYNIFEGKKNGLAWLNGQFKDFEGAIEIIKDGDVIAPVFFAENNNWLGGHFSNYLGADKKAIVLENYEASSGYFPIVWNSAEMPLHFFGKPSSLEECEYFGNRLSKYPFGKIDYVFIYGNRNDEPMCQALIGEVKKYYELVYSKRDVFLYKKIGN